MRRRPPRSTLDRSSAASDVYKRQPFALTRVNSLALFPNGDIAVTGYSQPGAGGTGKLVVQRFETSGNRLWTTDINYTNFDDEGKDVTVSSSGEVAVTGSSGTEALLCLLYTSDAADERSSVDLGGRRIIKKKKKDI